MKSLKPSVHVVWVSVDSYTSTGDLIGSLLGARSIRTPETPHDVLDEVLGALAPAYHQLSGDEVRTFLESRPIDPRPTWEQLSIF